MDGHVFLIVTQNIVQVGQLDRLSGGRRALLVVGRFEAQNTLVVGGSRRGCQWLAHGRAGR